jgi:hypothetical protein
VRREEPAKDRARTIFSFTLTDYRSIDPRLPDLTLHVIGPEGARQLIVRGRPLKLRSLVQEEGQGSAERAHHGPKPPVPVLVRSLLWLWLLLALLAVAAVVIVARRLWKRKKLPAEEEAAPLEPDEDALQRLAALRKSAPWEIGEGRAAIFALSEIVRGYLGARLHFDALDMTSEEFLEALHRRRLIGLDLTELTEEVRWEDLVKFAKLEPAAEECLRAISRSESMIHHTRLLRAVSQQGRAA